MERVFEKYALRIDVLFPDYVEVQSMVRDHGTNLFYKTPDLRKRCCHVRKVVPLRRRLGSLDAWITGLRRSQAASRADAQAIEWDETFGLWKINPLVHQSEESVWQYVRAHQVPYNPLHDKGFPSIGCQPCTRAVAQGEDPRTGRWWWEQEVKECGLHVVDGRLVRVKNPQAS
jgi:phosphoadenosine phosphosulfate reductase